MKIAKQFLISDLFQVSYFDIKIFENVLQVQSSKFIIQSYKDNKFKTLLFFMFKLSRLFMICNMKHSWQLLSQIRMKIG